MGSSINSMPLARAASCSLFLMGREASETSVSPIVKRLKPPPVPEIPTGTRTRGASDLKAKATASVIGYTVDEPSTLTEPEIATLLEIGEIRARLRFVHLKSHLRQRDLLTAEQIARYDDLRGYRHAGGRHLPDHRRN